MILPISKTKYAKQFLLHTLLLGLLSFVLAPQEVKADSAYPTSVTGMYNSGTGVLTLTVGWTWNNPSNKAMGVAAFADMNGDGIYPGPTDNPLTWTSGGNLVAGSAAAKSEFLGQLASSSIEGTAFPFGDATDTGIASGLAGFTTNTPRVLFPFGLADAKNPPLASTFILTYSGLTAAPGHICVILYDIHTEDNQTKVKDLSGRHSPISANPNRNDDNSLEEGHNNVTVSCTDPEGSIEFADLSLTKTVNNSTPMVGTNVIFTVTVTNNGPSTATNVKVKDLLPAGLSFVGSVPSQGAYVNGTGIWTVGTINNGASANIQITATVTSLGPKTNYAQVNSVDQPDPDSAPGNYSDDEDDDDEVTILSICPTITAVATPTAALCNGGNGKITMTMSGGSSPYDITWDGPGANDGTVNDKTTGYMILNLPAGNYDLTITDDNGCTKTTSATVTQPATMITGSAVPSSACNVNDGAIKVTASGGTPGYQVKWSGTSSGDPAGVEIASSGGMYNITGLTVGTYTITVTDANGCAFTTSSTVSTAGCCMVSASAGPNKTICPGSSTSIGGAPTGSGTPTLSYAWAPSGTLSSATAANPTATPAMTTTYTVTVTSTAGCTATASVTVSLYTAIVASGAPTDALCNGGTGKITMTMSGGASPYDLDWSGPSPGSTLNKTTGYMITNLLAGTYTITVTDDNSCTKTTSATVGQPPALTASGTPTAVACTGDANGKITMTIGGGTSPYDITWDGPGANDGTANNQASGYMITGLPAGTYNITITDENGCPKTTSATVGTANPLPVCDISDAMGVVCPNSTGNKYSATAGMDSYLWSIVGNGSIPGSKTGPMVEVSAGASGTYTVSVTITKNGCSSSCSKMVMIEMIPFMIVSTATYCLDDPGPVIGLNGSENGAMYQLQTAAGVNIGAPVIGTGAPIIFGSYPNGNYKVVITGGTCDATLTKAVSGTVSGCPIDVPNFCTCNSVDGRSEVTIKITAPFGQMWTVVEVVGLYGPNNPYPAITPGTPLTFMGMGMYKLEATRDNVKGFYVKVSNGFTEKNVQVGNPSW